MRTRSFLPLVLIAVFLIALGGIAMWLGVTSTGKAVVIAPKLESAPAAATAAAAELASAAATNEGVSTPPAKVASPEVKELKLPCVMGRVLDPRGAPLADARVYATWMARRESDGYTHEGKEAITDASGAYIIDGLTAGALQVIASHARYKESHRFLDLAPDETRAGLDLQVQDGASLVGRVIDVADRPLPGAKVVCIQSTPPARNSIVRHEATADSDGRFEVSGLNAESFEPKVILAGYVAAKDPRSSIGKELQAGAADVLLIMERGATIAGRVLLPDGSPATNGWVRARHEDTSRRIGRVKIENGAFELPSVDAGKVTVNAQSEGYQDSEVVELEVKPGADQRGLVFQLRTGSSLTGSVVDQTGQPLAGATISVLFADDRPMPVSNSCKSDDSGAFAIGGLESDTSYILRARLAGYLSIGDDTSNTHQAGAHGIKLVLERGATIAGTVSDASGVLAGAVVEVRLPRRTRSNTVAAPIATTNAEGKYALVGLTAGSHLIQCARPGTHPAVWRRIEIAHAEARSGEDFFLEPGGTLTGVVVDENETPIADLEVHLSRMIEGEFKDGMEYFQIRTDAKGEFAFHGLADANHHLSLSIPEGYSGIEGETMNLRPGNHYRIALTRGLTLRGRVVDPQAKPVPTFTVKSFYGADFGRGGMNRFKEFQSADGTFEWTGADPRCNRIEVASADYADAKVAIPDLLGETQHDFGDIVMHTGASLEGRVIDAQGAAVADAVVTATPASAGGGFVAMGNQLAGERTAKTDASGAFRITNLSPGRVIAFAAAPAGNSAAETLFIAEREQQSGLVLQLLEPGIIEGTMRGAGQQPQNGERIDLYAQSGSGGAQTSKNETTDAEGRFRFTGVLPGEYSVQHQSTEQVQLANGYTFSMRYLRVSVASGQTVTVEFPGYDACRVHGVVSLPEGFTGQRMLSFTTATERHPATIDENGAYEYKALPAGDYDVSIGMPLGKVTVPPAPEARFDFALRMPRITGRVRSSDGAPITSAVVALQWVSPQGAASGYEQVFPVSPDLTFSFLIAPGTYLALARTPEGSTSSQASITVDAEENEDLDLEIRSGAVVAVALDSPAAIDTSSFQIACISPEGVILQKATPDPAEPIVRLEGLPAGPAFICAVSDSQGYAMAAVDLAPGAVHETVLHIGGALGHARIRVTQGGAPFGHTTAWLTSADGVTILQVTYGRLGNRIYPSGASGCLTSLLPVGAYRVHVQNGEQAPVTQNFQINASQRTEVVVEIP